MNDWVVIVCVLAVCATLLFVSFQFWRQTKMLQATTTQLLHAVVAKNGVDLVAMERLAAARPKQRKRDQAERPGEWGFGA